MLPPLCRRPSVGGEEGNQNEEKVVLALGDESEESGAILFLADSAVQ